jgi:hypothetical protein
LAGIDTLQHKLINKGILPSIRRPKDVKLLASNIINEIAARQRKYANSVFINDSGVKGWIEVIDQYILDRVNQEYIVMHQ